MKYFACCVMVALVAATGFSSPRGDGESTTGLARMKDLIGSWTGTDAKGTAVTVSYKYVSDDNSIVESLGMGDHKDNMITVYYLDGNKTMLTHFCSMGNQPRMRLNKGKSSADLLAFNFVDATNLKSKKDPHMHNLSLVFKDKDHFNQEWTMAGVGKEHTSVFTFQRGQ